MACCPAWAAEAIAGSANTVMERFFLSLKMERVWQEDCANHTESCTDIADYIFNFCNAVRLYSTLDKLSPIAFADPLATKKPVGLSENLSTTGG